MESIILDAVPQDGKFQGLLKAANMVPDPLCNAAMAATLDSRHYMLDNGEQHICEYKYIAETPTYLRSCKKDIIESACKQTYAHYRNVGSPDSIDTGFYAGLLQAAMAKRAEQIVVELKNRVSLRTDDTALPLPLPVTMQNSIVAKAKAAFNREVTPFDPPSRQLAEHLVERVTGDIWQQIDNRDAEDGGAKYTSAFTELLEDNIARIIGITMTAIDSWRDDQKSDDISILLKTNADDIVSHAVSAFLNEFAADVHDSEDGEEKPLRNDSTLNRLARRTSFDTGITGITELTAMTEGTAARKIKLKSDVIPILQSRRW